MKCFIRRSVNPDSKLPAEFVEFNFALGDPSLGLEMVLPLAAFDEFCRQRNIDPQSGGEGWQADSR